jgi:hypothetical protein
MLAGCLVFDIVLAAEDAPDRGGCLCKIAHFPNPANPSATSARKPLPAPVDFHTHPARFGAGFMCGTFNASGHFC